jgi:hypothetical protein
VDLTASAWQGPQAGDEALPLNASASGLRLPGVDLSQEAVHLDRGGEHAERGGPGRSAMPAMAPSPPEQPPPSAFLAPRLMARSLRGGATCTQGPPNEAAHPP